jgi:hypothetical protein
MIAPAFVGSALSLRLDQIGHRIAPDIDETAGLEQRFDLCLRAAIEERQPIADRLVFGAAAGAFRRLRL